MSDNTILGIAQAGMQTGMDGLKKNAAAIASKDALKPQDATAGQSSSIPVNELVEMKMNKNQVLTSGKVLETVDEMLGTLLDEKA